MCSTQRYLVPPCVSVRVCHLLVVSCTCQAARTGPCWRTASQYSAVRGTGNKRHRGLLRPPRGALGVSWNDGLGFNAQGRTAMHARPAGRCFLVQLWGPPFPWPWEGVPVTYAALMSYGVQEDCGSATPKRSRFERACCGPVWAVGGRRVTWLSRLQGVRSSVGVRGLGIRSVCKLPCTKQDGSVSVVPPGVTNHLAHRVGSPLFGVWAAERGVSG